MPYALTRDNAGTIEYVASGHAEPGKYQPVAGFTESQYPGPELPTSWVAVPMPEPLNVQMGQAIDSAMQAYGALLTTSQRRGIFALKRELEDMARVLDEALFLADAREALESFEPLPTELEAVRTQLLSLLPSD